MRAYLSSLSLVEDWRMDMPDWCLKELLISVWRFCRIGFRVERIKPLIEAPKTGPAVRVQMRTLVKSSILSSVKMSCLFDS